MEACPIYDKDKTTGTNQHRYTIPVSWINHHVHKLTDNPAVSSYEVDVLRCICGAEINREQAMYNE